MKNKGGFTIIELVLFMGILGLFLTVLTQVFHSAMDTLLESVATSSIDQTSSFLVHRLEYDVRRATNINTPTSIGQTSSTLSLFIGEVNHVYSVNNGRLQITDTSGTAYLSDIYTNVSGFAVQRLGAATGKNTVRIEFLLTTTDTNLAGRAQTRNVSTSIGLR